MAARRFGWVYVMSRVLLGLPCPMTEGSCYRSGKEVLWENYASQGPEAGSSHLVVGCGRGGGNASRPRSQPRFKSIVKLDPVTTQ